MSFSENFFLSQIIRKWKIGHFLVVAQFKSHSQSYNMSSNFILSGWNHRCNKASEENSVCCNWYTYMGWVGGQKHHVFSISFPLITIGVYFVACVFLHTDNFPNTYDSNCLQKKTANNESDKTLSHYSGFLNLLPNYQPCCVNMYTNTATQWEHNLIKSTATLQLQEKRQKLAYVIGLYYACSHRCVWLSTFFVWKTVTFWAQNDRNIGHFDAGFNPF